MAIAMKSRDVKLDDLNAVRYYLAYLYWACEEYYDAAVMGEFLARAYPESAGAKAGAKIAMAAYGQLFNQAPEDDRDFETAQMLKLAEHVGKTWANEPDADDAWLTVVRTAVINGDLPQAMEYLKRIPDASPRRGEAELMVGQSIWNRYLQGMRQVAEEQTPQDKDEMKKKLKLKDDAELAEKTLEAGVTRMRKIVDSGEADVSYPLVASVLSLAQVLLETGQAEKAVKWLDDPKVGAMTLVAANAPVTQRGAFPIEVYKAALAGLRRQPRHAEGRKDGRDPGSPHQGGRRSRAPSLRASTSASAANSRTSSNGSATKARPKRSRRSPRASRCS